MKVIAIDPSLTCTGLYFDDPILGGIGRAIVRRKEHKKDRYAAIYRTYNGIRHVCRHNFDLAVVEQYAYAAVGSARTVLVEVGAAVRLALKEQRIPFIEIAPGTWKKIVIGNGGVKKDVVIAHVEKYYSRHFDAPDIYDAFCMYVAVQLSCTSTLESTNPLFSKIEEALGGRR